MRFYQFVAQVVYLHDTMLEKYFAYADYLLKFLPNRTIPQEVKITDEMIRLTALRIEKTEVGDASLNPGNTKSLSPVDEFGINKAIDEDLRNLAQIIKEFNDRNGTNFTESEFLNFDSTGDRPKYNDDLRNMILNNTSDVVYKKFAEVFLKEMIDQINKQKDFNNIFLTDRNSRDMVTRYQFNTIVKYFKSGFAP